MPIMLTKKNIQDVLTNNPMPETTKKTDSCLAWFLESFLKVKYFWPKYPSKLMREKEIMAAIRYQK